MAALTDNRAAYYVKTQFADDPTAAAAFLAEKYNVTVEQAAKHVAAAVEQIEDGLFGELPHSTDTGNASRLVRAFGDRIRYLYDSTGRGTWLAWDGKRWAPDATGAVERYAKRTVRQMYVAASKIENEEERTKAARWAMASESAGRLDAMVKLARSHEAIVVTADELDADTWQLNVGNGIVDLRTGDLLPHDQAAMHTKLVTADYEPDAACPGWDSFLAQVLPDADVRDYVQRLVGYSLTGEVGENVLPFAYGPGANGKSVLYSVLRALLGDYATQAAPGLLEAKRERGIPADIADLRGFRFVTAQEVEPGRRMATEAMKTLTGEPELKARRLYQGYETFRNVTTLWMAANDRPVVDGLDAAVWRRIRLIPFEVVIPKAKQDTELVSKLLAERDGILAWAVKGCMAWQARGLDAPDAVMLATDDYRKESHPLTEWIESHCELDPGAVVAGAELRENYEAWCLRTRSRKVPGGSKWTAALQRLGVDRPPDTDDQGRTLLDGQRVRAWQGIRLRERPTI